jgi:hypothetical protein
MSNTELQRALRKIQSRWNRLRDFIQFEFAPLFRLRSLKGVILDPRGRPIHGVRVSLNGWRHVITDEEGAFSFHLIWHRVYSLSLQWRGAELTNWIQVNAHRDRVTDLKLRWPLLLRGQLINIEGHPLSQVNVKLNDRYMTQTDIHGAFFFPRLEGDQVRFERFMFDIDDVSFIHHFNLNLDSNVLYRFLYHEGSLYHVDEQSQALPNSAYVSTLAQQFSWAKRSVFALLTLIVLSIFIKPSTSFNPQAMLRNQPQKLATINPRSSAVGLTSRFDDTSSTKTNADLPTLDDLYPARDDDEGVERPPSPLSSTDLTSANDSRSGASIKGAQITPSLELEGENFLEGIKPEEECQDVEFKYYGYSVPRGMEGILLSIIFGRWQSWGEDLSKMNRMKKSDQLQAGQRIKLMLPLFPWRIFHVSSSDTAPKLLNKMGCKEEPICSSLIQAWNPHLDLRSLRKGDQLLMNPSLLLKRPFTADSVKRIEKTKRFRAGRRKRPKLRFPKNCALKPLQLDKAYE